MAFLSVSGALVALFFLAAVLFCSPVLTKEATFVSSPDSQALSPTCVNTVSNAKSAVDATENTRLATVNKTNRSDSSREALPVKKTKEAPHTKGEVIAQAQTSASLVQSNARKAYTSFISSHFSYKLYSYTNWEDVFESLVFEAIDEGTADEDGALCIDTSDLALYYDASDTTDYGDWQAMVDVFADIINRNPDYFYINSEVRCTYNISDGLIVDFYITLNITDEDELAEAKQAYEEALETAVSAADGYTGALAQGKAIHDYLVRHCTYNVGALNALTAGTASVSDYWYIYTAYGALVKAKPVYQGYALAFSACMQRLGVATEYISQYTRAGWHGWNRLKADGNWYNVDIAWDDPVNSKGVDGGSDIESVSVDFFAKSDEYWICSHFTSRGSKYYYYDKCGSPSAADFYYNYDDSDDWASYMAEHLDSGTDDVPTTTTDTSTTATDTAASVTKLTQDTTETTNITETTEMTLSSKLFYNRRKLNAKHLAKCTRKNGLSTNLVTCVVVGKNVRKIAKKTFAAYPQLKTLVIKSRRLRKGSVKKCLKASYVDTVRVSSAAFKRYKKIFRKKIVGAKVTIKRL